MATGMTASTKRRGLQRAAKMRADQSRANSRLMDPNRTVMDTARIDATANNGRKATALVDRINRADTVPASSADPSTPMTRVEKAMRRTRPYKRQGDAYSTLANNMRTSRR